MSDVEVSSKAERTITAKFFLIGVLPAFITALIVLATLYASGVLPGKLSGDNYDGNGYENLPAIYSPLDPSFVVNFSGQGNARFLQITVEVMTRSSEVIDQIKIHMPAIRNNLNMLFSDQHYDKISTLEGKERLREEALVVIQRILEEETGNPGLEAVYFTRFVME
jgi:flagellar basal body-associated protein FliL